MKLVFPLLLICTNIIAIKVLTTTEDIKHFKGNNWVKLDIQDVNGGFMKISFILFY